MEITGEHTEWNVDDTVNAMVNSKNIIIVPGYGLAVAKGQYPVAELVSNFWKPLILIKYFYNRLAQIIHTDSYLSNVALSKFFISTFYGGIH